MKEKKKKDPKKKKRALIITGSILGVFALFVITVVMITIIGDKANIKRAESYDPVVIENQLVPEKDENGYWTFTTDRDLKIMQLTDIHLGGGWLSLKKDSQAINAVATMIQAEKPDLVIMDITMPNKTGIEALKEIKAMDAGAKVVMCSAMGQEAMVVEAIKLGALDFIVKPFKAERILQTVKKILD